jgi:ABC-type nitrate/sulfonate/bicarbonate transport system permease component
MPNQLIPMLWVSALSIVIGLAFWKFCTTQFSNFFQLPSLSVFAQFLDPNFALRLAKAVSGSLIQLGIGFGLALAVAVPLGTLLGRTGTLLRDLTW